MHKIVKAIRLPWIAALSVGLALPLWAADKPVEAEYVRFHEHAQGAGLQVAVVQMRHPKTGVQVDLVGAVHIADKAYFEGLNKLFKGYDRLLYEMVKPKNLDPAQPREPNHKPSGISRLQNFMGEKLELEFQLDVIDYSAKNFVHADMTPKQFAKRQKARGESMLSLMFKSFRQELAAQKNGHGAASVSTAELLRALFSPDFAVDMKYIFGKQFNEMERITAGLDSDEGSVILTERNDVALKILKKELASGHKKLGIFYGAAHLPDMEKKLIEDFGFKRTGHHWRTAWALPKRPRR